MLRTQHGAQCAQIREEVEVEWQAKLAACEAAAAETAGQAAAEQAAAEERAAAERTSSKRQVEGAEATIAAQFHRAAAQQRADHDKQLAARCAAGPPPVYY